MQYAACAWMIVAVALVGGAGPTPLEGTWEVTELTAYGEKVDPKFFAGTKFVFEKDKLTVVPPNDKQEEFVKRTFTIKLDGKKNPAEVDLTALDGEHKGTTSPGIYELNGDTLRWCQPDGPKTTDRPKTFTSPEKSDTYLFTLKRVAAKPK